MPRCAISTSIRPPSFNAAFKGGGASIIENFTAGHYIGVPLLQAYGMSCEPHRAVEKGLPPFPHMRRWMR